MNAENSNASTRGETRQDAAALKCECNLLNQQGTCRLSPADFRTAAQARVSMCVFVCAYVCLAESHRSRGAPPRLAFCRAVSEEPVDPTFTM